MMVLAILLGGAGAIALRRSPRKIGRIGIAVGLPLLVWLPWWPTLILAPARLLVGPDSALEGAPAAPSVGALLLGRGLGPGLPPWWVGAVVFGVIWAAALVGLARRPRRRTVLAAWTTGLLSLGLAVVLSRLVVAVPPAGAEVRPWVGTFVLVGFAALLIGGGVGADGISADVTGRSFSWLQPLAVLAGLAVTAVTIGGALWWVWAGARGPIERTGLDAVPPYLRVSLDSDTRARVLALDLSADQTRYSVLSGDAVRLGDADRGFAFGGSVAARTTLTQTTARLVAGTADADITPQLRALGIGYVWVTGLDDEDRARIDNTPGLGAASGNERSTVWQLDPPGSRAAVVDGQNLTPLTAPPAVLPPGSADRRLLIGEAADPRWRAEVDGAELTPVTDGWQQGFALPAAGTLTWSLPNPAHWLLPAQGLVLLIGAVLAAPGIRRPDVRDPVKFARRAATLSELG